MLPLTRNLYCTCIVCGHVQTAFVYETIVYKRHHCCRADPPRPLTLNVVIPQLIDEVRSLRAESDPIETLQWLLHMYGISLSTSLDAITAYFACTCARVSDSPTLPCVRKKMSVVRRHLSESVGDQLLQMHSSCANVPSLLNLFHCKRSQRSPIYVEKSLLEDPDQPNLGGDSETDASSNLRRRLR